MEIILVSYGNYRDNNYKNIVEDFIARIQHYYRFTHKLIDPRKKYKSKDPAHRKEIEKTILFDFLNTQDLLILLDEKGKEFSSRGLAHQLDKWLITGKNRIVFVIGGAYGFSESVYTRSESKLALSRLTLNHQIARIMWLEQLYRACTILRGESYHND